jgi:hypothetical protein
MGKTVWEVEGRRPMRIHLLNFPSAAGAMASEAGAGQEFTEPHLSRVPSLSEA